MDLGKALVVVCYVTTILAWIFVILRCYVRGIIVKSFGWDDWLMLLAMMLSTLQATLTIVSVHYGLGKHAITLTPSQLSHAIKYQNISQPFYISSAVFIKISIGILLLRIASTTFYRHFIIASMVIMTVFSSVVFFAVLVQCRPLSLSWDVNLTDEVRAKHCMNRGAFAALGYGFSGVDIFFNWTFALLPIPMLRNLQMSLQVKLSLFLVLGLGAFASTTTLVRLQYLVAEKNVKDFTFAITNGVIWTTLEVNFDIIAACMATLRPLFKNWSIRGFSSDSRSKRRTNGQMPNPRSYALSHVTTTAGNNKSTAISSRKFVKLNEAHTSHTSQESIIDHAGIQKRIDVDVVYEV